MLAAMVATRALACIELSSKRSLSVGSKAPMLPDTRSTKVCDAASTVIAVAVPTAGIV